MKNLYRIAGLTISMDSFGRTAEQAENYRCDSEDQIDIVIESPWENNKHLHPNLSNDDGEYLATGSVFYKNLLRHNGLMLHSSAVVVNGRAYLFTADSGVGKSTHTKLWLELFGERAYILNDDKPALRYLNGTWFAFGTPWSGKHDISANTCAPIAGIAILVRSETNEISRFSGLDVIQRILRQVNRPRDAESRELLLELINQLILDIPIWKLKCNMSLDAAITAYEAMSHNDWR